jgi:GNAT superfamily N-acetyltransferase
MEIRAARPADVPAIAALIGELAAFEKLPAPDAAAAERLTRDAFGEGPRLELWVAEIEGAVAAYAATFMAYSTFRALPSLYLEDLFVSSGFRRRGIATALLARLRAEGERRGCGRFEWMVLDWNEGAKALYAGVGARILRDLRLARIDLPTPGKAGEVGEPS